MLGNMFFRNCEQNALFNIANSLSFKDRYNFSVISKALFEKVFEKYQHQEIININYREHEKIDKYPKINFYVKIYYDDSKIINKLPQPVQNKLFKKMINAYGIRLCQIDIQNMSIFKNLHKVDLFMTNATDLDLSNLINVRDLQIQSCDNVYNIPYLKHLHKFLLMNNKNVSDISNLSHVKNIKFAYCPKIINFEPIKNVNYLDLCTYDEKNISMLINLKYLTLNKYQNISTLSNIKVLTLFMIKNTEFFHMLPDINCETLILKYCDVSDLSKIQSKKIKHLILYRCREITKMPIFDNLEKLSFYDCRNISDISNLNLSPKLKIINLSKYQKLDYSILTNIEQINTNVLYEEMIGKYDRIKN